jgi:hypothetical protein
MSSIACGDKEWANLDVLVYDAASAQTNKQFVQELRWILGAIAARGPIRFSEGAYNARLKFSLNYDAATKEYVLEPYDSKG